MSSFSVETKAKGAAPAKKAKGGKGKKGSATKTKVTAPAAAGGDDVESKVAAMEAAKKAKAEVRFDQSYPSKLRWCLWP